MGSVRTGMIIVSVVIIVVVFLPTLPTISIFLFLLMLVFVGVFFKPVRRSVSIFLPLMLGLLWASGYGYLGLKQLLPFDLEGVDVWVEGEVVGLPVERERSQRFELKVITVELSGQPVELSLQKVRINWYQTSLTVKPGERWRFLLRLKRPHGFANPGGFDYQGWLFQQSIGATGYVRKHEDNHQLAAAGYRQLLDQWRYLLYQRLSERLENYPNKGLMLALLMGERGDISNSQWQLLSRTGTNHLFVISGLHVGFVALCAYLVFFNLSRLLLIGPPHIAAQQVGVCSALICSFAYAGMAGFSLPTQRALIMLVVMLAGRLLRRRVNIWHSYLMALLLVLLWDPLAPQSVGFWLSFGAVGSLMYAFSLRTDSRGIWWRWLRPQWVVFVAFIPVLLFFFQQVSLISPLANVVAIPVVGLFMVPVCVFMAVLEIVLQFTGSSWIEGLARLFSWLSSYSLSLLILFLNLLAELPFAQWKSSLSVWGLALAIAGVLLLLAPRGLPARWLALCCFLPIFISNDNQPSIGAFEMTVLDVGQGLSVHISTRHHHLIYDVGARFNANFDVSSAVILPYLRKRDIESLDRVVISHGDNDHAGSLPVLLAGMPVTQVISGASQVVDNSIETISCQDDFSWQWDEVTFLLMQADQSLWSNENNRSCVLKISSKNFGVLISGDIEAAAERGLLEKYGETLQVDVLLAPHHGSQSSSSAALLDQVKPNLVIVSSGYRNRFGHPHPKVVARYQQRQIEVINTAEQGAITLSSQERQIEPVVESYRQEFKRYWF